MKRTKIEWCDATVNPVIGCTFGCPYCYANRMNNRFGYIPDFTRPQFFEERLHQLDSKRPKAIFMNSMSDIADWKTRWVILTEQAIARNPQHVYLFLTKRPERAQFIFTSRTFNGVSVTKQSEIDRLNYVPSAANRFISIEPIHGRIDLAQATCLLHWVIIGAETGSRKGRVIPHREWIKEIVDYCDDAGIPVYMKDSLLKVLSPEEMRREYPLKIQQIRSGQ